MHYSTLVVVDKPENIEDVENAVNERLAPYHEQHFDWHQIGGRWTGLLDGYDPEKDSANIGADKRVKWPTEWVSHPGDIAPLESLTDEQYAKFHHVVCEYGWFAPERYVPWAEGDAAAKFQAQEMPPLAWLKEHHPGALAVVVDCHS